MTNEDRLTRALNRLDGRLDASEKAAKKAQGKVVPLGMERVDAETEARRWARMGPEERRRFIEEHGVEHALDTDQRARRQGHV